MRALTAADGFRHLLAGFGLLLRPGLKRYVFVPLCVNLLLFAGLIWWSADSFQALLDWMMPQLPDWLAWLSWLLWLVFGLLSMLILFFTFTLLANLIAAPFNGLLAAKAEFVLTGRAPPEAPAGGLSGLLAEVTGALGDELRKLGFFAMWGGLLVLVSLVLLFIPILNMLIAPLWFLFGAWLMTLEYADYPLGNHGLDFTRQRAHIRANTWPAMGFGTAAMLVTLIPVVNFVVMPAAVVGATRLWLERPPGAGRPAPPSRPDGI